MDGGGDQQTPAYGPVPVTQGDWAGWSSWSDLDPFEDLTGPYYFRRQPDGSIICAMRCEAKQLNGSKRFMHGGAIMTFADYCLFIVAQDALAGAHGVTATLNCEFVGAIAEGDLVECTGEVTRGGKSLIFVRGLMNVGGKPVMTWSGVIKKVGRAG